MSPAASIPPEAATSPSAAEPSHEGPAARALLGLRERVLAALGTVYDPELDEPITALRFVAGCRVSQAGDVEVRLRLPTPQCAPNFAFLMGSDARRAVSRVSGVREVAVTLEDHYTGEEINRALGRGAGFTAAFPGETGDDDLESLRALFHRKALIARQGRLCEAMLAAGWTRDAIVTATIADLPPGRASERVLELRAALGLDCRDDAAAFVSPGGQPVDGAGLERWLRGARLVATGLEANGGICRSLLQFRYQLGERDTQSEEEEEDR
jgi:metal-sulfur cluster biosynthetic enzyme